MTIPDQSSQPINDDLENRNSSQSFPSNKKPEGDNNGFSKIIQKISSQSFYNLPVIDCIILVALLGLLLTTINLFLDRGNGIAYRLFGSLEDGYIQKRESTSAQLSKEEKDALAKKDALAQLQKKIRLDRAEKMQAKINNLTIPDSQKRRLIEQIEETHKRAMIHLAVTRFFYVENFSAISLTTIAAIIAAVALLFITRKGWDRVHRIIVYIFIISTGTATLCSVFVVAFKYDSNITENKQLYIAYTALEERINSYFATGQFVMKGNPEQQKTLKESVEVIQQIDSELATLHNIAIGFDLTKLPNYQELYNGISQ